MRQCKFCGRSSTRLVEIRTAVLNFHDGWKCVNPIACIKRMQRLGQWEGKRVLRRLDPDGTQWTIRRIKREGMSSSGPWFTLTCDHRNHHLTSWHPTIDSAKSHVDELIASFTNPHIDDYRVEEPAEDQLELM